MLVYLLLAAATLGLCRTANLTDCYYFNDVVSANNTICPDSSACCGPTATYTSERVCHNQGDPADVFIRGPCASSTWDLDSCSQICRYNEQNGVFSRVKQCSDKSWCCSEKTGSDVAADIAVCCANGQGVFLNSKGVIVDDTTSTSTPTSTTSLTTIVSPISSHSPSTTASSTVTSDDSGRSSHGNLSTGAKAGIGVGAAVAGIFLLAALAALWTKLHNRRRAVDYTKRHSEVAFTMQDQEPLSSSGNGGSLPQPCGGLERKDRVPREPPELQAYAPI